MTTSVKKDNSLKMLELKLFNQATHYYTLTVDNVSVKVDSNDESKAFNDYTTRVADPSRCIDKENIVGYGCFGNQHAEAVVRDMCRVRQWDVQTLREYSMFTIGDFLIVTEENLYFSVNGDLVVKGRTDGYVHVRGNK